MTTASFHHAARIAAPELLCPAGDFEAMRAAVANGADAVYFGLPAFNARHRAANFSLDDLPRTIEYLHSHNVRGYVALNVLIFSDELPAAVEFVRAIAAAGADAVIVQDLGLARLIHRLCPTLPIHGSTQMTLTEPMGIEFVRALGVSRLILARELSLKEIRSIHQATDMPLEVFVHGALCVAYSGQCLTSEALGGRSANRGQCAQACRLPYDLIVDGQHRDLGDRKYLLSPLDLAAHDLIDDLAEAGVQSFKIEGRLKSPHYVAATTQTYRDAIDSAAAHRPFAATIEQQQNLAQSFSRGFSHGFLDGVDHQQLVQARFPKKRGIRAGRVIGISDRGVIVELEKSPPTPGKNPPGAPIKPAALLKAGDGIVFDDGHPDQDEQGGRIFGIFPRGKAVEITFGRGEMNLQSIAEGSIVWKTDDPQIRRRLEISYGRDRVVKRIPLSARVIAAVGQKLSIELDDDAGHHAEVEWDRPLEEARKFPATLEIFREQFGRMGDTPFELGRVEVNGQIDGAFPPVMIPKSVLNDLRRQAVERILAQIDGKASKPIDDPNALSNLREEIARFSFSSPGVPGAEVNAGAEGIAESKPSLHLLARGMEQLQAILRWKPDRLGDGANAIKLGCVHCEFEDIRLYPRAIELARQTGVTIGLAAIRIIKPGEEGFLRQIAAAAPDVVLIRNLAALALFRREFPELPLVADYALNVANELTAAILLEHGVRRITPSYDLTWKQLATMAARFPVKFFEAVIHQHMPMFHMEHCVFAHTLSNGRDFHDCGRPCEKHHVEIRAREGAVHPLMANVGCRNTVFNGVAQSGAEFVGRMKELGIRHFRIELLRETPAQAIDLLDRYARVLAGVDDGRNAWRELKVLNQLGVTRGTLE